MMTVEPRHEILWDQQGLRPACTCVQSDQSPSWSLKCSMTKLLAEQHLEFQSLKGAAQARLSLHLSKCHIVGNLMSWHRLYHRLK